MKTRTRNVGLLLVLGLLVACLSMAGCGGGGSGKEEKSPYEGKWVAVSAQMMGMSISIDEAFGGTFEFDAKSGGEVSFTVDDETGKGTWSAEGNQFTLSIEGEDVVGTLGDNTITFDDMLEMGATIIFAKAGTDAANPNLYLTEEESNIIGAWASTSVEEFLSDEPQTSMEGVSDIHDGLRLNFKNDRNVAVVYKGKEIGTFPWSVALGLCTVECDDPMILITLNDDGTLDADYSNDDDYYTFHLVKK